MNGDTATDADATSTVPKTQLTGSSTTLEFTAQCASVDGGGRGEATADIASAPAIPAKPSKEFFILFRPPVRRPVLRLAFPSIQEIGNEEKNTTGGIRLLARACDFDLSRDKWI